MKTTPLALAGLLILGALAVVPLANAGHLECESTSLPGGFTLVTCDPGGDGIPNYVCVTGPRPLGPCMIP